MAKQKYYQLTTKSPKFSQGITDNINKDFPGSAMFLGGCCWLTEEYWNKCVAEVMNLKTQRNLKRYGVMFPKKLK